MTDRHWHDVCTRQLISLKATKQEVNQRLAKLEAEADELRKTLRRLDGGIQCMEEELAKYAQENTPEKNEPNAKPAAT